MSLSREYHSASQTQVHGCAAYHALCLWLFVQANADSRRRHEDYLQQPSLAPASLTVETSPRIHFTVVGQATSAELYHTVNLKLCSSLSTFRIHAASYQMTIDRHPRARAMAPRTFVELAANPSIEQDMSDAELSVIFSSVTVETFYQMGDPKNALLRYHHGDPATIYQAKVPQNELGAHDVRVRAKLLHYATAEASILQGALLGVTGRIDFVRISYTAPPLRGHSLLSRITYGSMPNTATFQWSATNGSEQLRGFLRAPTEEVHDSKHEALPDNNVLTSTSTDGLGRLGKLLRDERFRKRSHLSPQRLRDPDVTSLQTSASANC